MKNPDRYIGNIQRRISEVTNRPVRIHIGDESYVVEEAYWNPNNNTAEFLCENNTIITIMGFREAINNKNTSREIIFQTHTKWSVFHNNVSFKIT